MYLDQTMFNHPEIISGYYQLLLALLHEKVIENKKAPK